MFSLYSLCFLLHSLRFPCIHCVSLCSLCFPCIPYVFYCIPTVSPVFLMFSTVFTVFSLYTEPYSILRYTHETLRCVFCIPTKVFPVFTVFYCVHWYSLCFHCIPYVVPVSPKFCYIKYLMVFRVWISNHAGCWETWEKCKKARVARRVFLAFRRKSNNIPSVWIRISKHGKPLGISFIK